MTSKLTTRRFRNSCALAAALAACLTALCPAAAQEVVRLWPEQTVSGPREVVQLREDGDWNITDVVDPTLTVYLPDPALANGTAIILAPGGAMRVLHVEPFEHSTARWLNARGIAVFELHYRTLPTTHQLIGTMGEMRDFPFARANPFPGDPVMTATIADAIADGQQAVRLVRANAQAWNIDPARVGILGVSAGGAAGIGALTGADEAARPDFFISSFAPSLIDVVVPENKPPIFIAVRQFHPNVARALVSLYEVWTDAGAPAELHIYDQLDGTPFLEPTGEWLDDAYHWMQKRGIVPDASVGDAE
jgi:dienelactone hydrolase